MDPGHRAGRQAGHLHREEHPQRRIRAAVRRGRLDVRRRGRARAARRRCRSTISGTSGWPFIATRVFLKAAEAVAVEMNNWAQGFFGRSIIQDWRTQLDFTTKIFRARGLHLDDRHVRRDGRRRLLGVDRRCRLYVTHNQQRLARVRRVGRALPAEDSDGRGSGALARHAVGASSSISASRSARSRATCSSSSSRRCSS